MAQLKEPLGTMDPNMLMMMAMLSNSTSGGGGSDQMLPLLLMNVMGGGATGSLGNGSENGGNGEDMVKLLVYQPMSKRIMANFTTKVSNLSERGRNKLLAAVAVDSLSRNQSGEFGSILALTARAGMQETIGDPITGMNAPVSQSNERSKGKVGGEMLGDADITPREKARGIDIDTAAANVKSKAPAPEEKKSGRAKTPVRGVTSIIS